MNSLNELETNILSDLTQELHCDLRGAGESYHVEYVLNEPDGIEMENITHSNEPRSDDDLKDDEIEIGWVAETDSDVGFVLLQIFEGSEGLHTLHRLRWETCFQLADMFKLVAERAKEVELVADAAEIAEGLELDRQNQPLPFAEEPE